MQPCSWKYRLSNPESHPPHLVEFLFSESAQQATTLLTPEDLQPEAALATLTRLRRRFAADEAAALLTLARLRQRARSKFPDAQRMFLVTRLSVDSPTR